ncbi:glycoside hydrolase family 38 C-terminal domain-containing protein [Mollicutes bacterium LVI A0078]|nr:glycoside hydrolase family 38 C-terminal domain-containing protein [Mollicutes bacterium LVI A0075]WOO91398.1 glycoside hydrolase family 38 C-terminal domain-containing protein [Mollicutes bacterium LVI A0078]
MRQTKIIMHTHWDREWYFTKDETQTILRTHMYEVIEYLEENQDIKYILDGQSVMIDDFLEFAPDYKERLGKLIANGQLLVGPWYTQTDLMLVHGESIIRNLYYGIKRALEFTDKPMLNGYAPDTFGHNSQMPQIYKQFGIDNTIFWRGFSELKADKSDFLWKGVDGSVIYGINLATGYQGAKYLESDPKELEVRMGKIMNVLDNYSATDARLVMNGHDQMPIQRNIKDIISILKEFYSNDDISVGTFEDYLDVVRRADLEEVEGELVHSKHARIHKTINSTRMDIKLLNTELEYKLFNILEPLAILGTKIDIDYPHDVFDKCYKIMFGAHAHDSIGGCNTDGVNADIKQRLIQVKEVVDTQIEMYMRYIAQTQVNIGDITVFNYLPYKRENELVDIDLLVDNKDFIIVDEQGKEISYVINNHEVIDAGTIDRQIAARLLDVKTNKYSITASLPSIEGLSVKKLKVVEGQAPTQVISSNSVENDYYKIDIIDNKLTLFNKHTGQTVSEFISIENSADVGDSYDYSPPVVDKYIKPLAIANVSMTTSKLIKKLNFDIEFLLPANFKNREAGIDDTNMTFNVTLTLDSSKLIKTTITTKNKVKDSRFRLVVRTDCTSKTVTTDMQLSKITRPIYNYAEMAVWEEEKWAEKPVAIETFNSYINYSDENSYNVVYAYGHKEYEVKDSTIYVTLFRSFSQLGKRELVNRPGRPSGIEVPTPDNQLDNTEFKMEFAISFIKDEMCEANIAKEWLTPISGYQLKKYNRFNVNDFRTKVNYDSLQLDLKGCTISAIKYSLDNELVIRLFNENDPVTIDFANEVVLTDMLENNIEKTSQITVNTNQIVTVKL